MKQKRLYFWAMVCIPYCKILNVLFSKKLYTSLESLFYEEIKNWVLGVLWRKIKVGFQNISNWFAVLIFWTYKVFFFFVHFGENSGLAARSVLQHTDMHISSKHDLFGSRWPKNGYLQRIFKTQFLIPSLWCLFRTYRYISINEKLKQLTRIFLCWCWSKRMFPINCMQLTVLGYVQ